MEKKLLQQLFDHIKIETIDHSLKKLQLKAGETLLDIGCGWGRLITGAAQQYGVKATGITVSKEQYEKTKKRITEMQLDHLAEVLLMDYRELIKTGRKFSKIGIGMFEHVGRANMPVYMTAVRDLLEEDGLSLLHTVTHPNEGPVNPWIDKYISPGGFIPSLREVVWLLPDYDFHLLDIECLLPPLFQSLPQSYDFHLYNGLSIYQILFSKGLSTSFH